MKSTAGAILDRCANSQCAVHDGCRACHGQAFPCEIHKCRRCDGSGLVCPACRGDRIVQLFEWTIATPHIKVGRCEICCEGNQVNSAKEQRAIDAYLAKQRRAQVKQQMSLVEKEGGAP